MRARWFVAGGVTVAALVVVSVVIGASEIVALALALAADAGDLVDVDG